MSDPKKLPCKRFRVMTVSGFEDDNHHFLRPCARTCELYFGTRDSKVGLSYPRRQAWIPLEYKCEKGKRVTYINCGFDFGDGREYKFEVSVLMEHCWCVTCSVEKPDMPVTEAGSFTADEDEGGQEPYT